MKRSKKRVLVAPLDWGLGHATRCIPIIRQLLASDVEVIIAADRRPLKLLQQEFPDLEFVRLPGMEVNYPKKISMTLYMALKAPAFLKWIAHEHELLKSIIENYHIDGLISDNRYGLYHDRIPTVLMTHQLFIKANWGEGILEKLTERYANRFSNCWVPDLSSKGNLSGELSHQAQECSFKNLSYIGPLSRFSRKESEASYERDLMVIISGPEPNRTKFEAVVREELKKNDFSYLMVRGLVGENGNGEGAENEVMHLNAAKMEAEIRKSAMVLCRSGYSSIMDLAVLQKKAILIPTPGQPEQEYLADRLMQLNQCYAVKEADFNLRNAMHEAVKYEALCVKPSHDLLEAAVQQFLGQIDSYS